MKTAEEIRKRNLDDKQAAESFKRLASGEFPKVKVKMNYSESKSIENEECSLLMVKRYWSNACKALSSIVNSTRSALQAKSTETINHDPLRNRKQDYLNLAKKFHVPISAAIEHYDTLSRADNKGE